MVQAASFQSGSVISNQGNAWTRLVAEGGLSATAVLQAPLSVAVARAVKAVRPQAHFINCCFADVVNPLIAALDLPITCGVGNVAILANAFAGALGLGPGRLKMLAHYQNLAPFRRPADTRGGPAPRVFIDGAEVADVYRRFADVVLTREPAIEISGASGVPLMLAMAAGRDWSGHVPGPRGLARRLSGPARGGRDRARPAGFADARGGDRLEPALRAGERSRGRRGRPRDLYGRPCASASRRSAPISPPASMSATSMMSPVR